MHSKREAWLDAAKGLAIILVVAGHSYNHYSFITYIYWFHMPAFFLFSGYVSRPAKQWSKVIPLIKKRAQSLLLPYFRYLGVFTAIRYAVEVAKGNVSVHWYLQDIGTLLFGGRFITGSYGVFWFVTCLFITQILFLVVFLLFKRTYARLAIIASMYLLAHLQGIHTAALDGAKPALDLLIPWNADVALLALFYYSIGYYVKISLKQLPVWLTAGCVLLSAGCIALQETGRLDYHLSMKYISYEHYGLDIVIPLMMTAAYCGVFQLIRSARILSLFSFISRRSMAIMYLHIGVNKVLLSVTDYGNIVYTIVGVITPLLFSVFILEKRYSLPAILFQSGTKRYTSYTKKQATAPQT